MLRGEHHADASASTDEQLQHAALVSQASVILTEAESCCKSIQRLPRIDVNTAPVWPDADQTSTRRIVEVILPGTD